MKTVYMLDEQDVREEVAHVLSNAYEGKDWCEDGSVRQDIKDLKSNVVDIDNDIEKSHSDIHMLQLKVDNNISVLARHSLELSEALTEIDKLNKKIDVLVESIADIDSLESFEKKLEVLTRYNTGENGWLQK